MDKYIDNKLAEELDLIVLITDRLSAVGFQKGAVGTLIQSYTGKTHPLFADFEIGKKHKEVRLKLEDFRVLNPRWEEDIAIIAGYMRICRAV